MIFLAWGVNRAEAQVCGDGTLDAGEQCDAGAGNNAPGCEASGTCTSCCSFNCQFMNSGTLCRAAAGVCDVAETCPGNPGPTGACPADVFDSSTECRSVNGVCDVAETCDGTGPNCPADAYQPGSVECNPSLGVCDPAENCTGSGPNCPPDQLSDNTVQCRGVVGTCDAAENCTGFDVGCPADLCTDGDAFGDPAGNCDGCDQDCNVSTCGDGVLDTYSCEQCDDGGNANGDGCSATCTVEAGFTCDGGSPTACSPICGDGIVVTGEQCDAGAGNNPGNCAASGTCTSCCSFNCQFENLGTQCRASAGACDPAETCPNDPGPTGACPADVLATAGTECRPGDLCDPAEQCDGVSTSCPADVLRPSGYVCRAAVGACDDEETCDGVATTCPGDLKQPSGFVCRPAVDVCDVQEVCDGLGDACPGDAFAGSGTPCNDTKFCTQVDQCNGVGVCVGSVDPCTAGPECANTCDEVNDTCNLPSGTPCTQDGLFCTGQEQCDGSGVCAPTGNPCTGGSQCNTQCNETTPNNGNCFNDAGAACGDPSDTPCDDPDSCNGAGTCLTNTLPNGATCTPLVTPTYTCGAVLPSCQAGDCLLDGGDPDNDGLCSLLDNCPMDRNPDQADFNNNGVGDACDRTAPAVSNTGLVVAVLLLAGLAFLWMRRRARQM